jgi:predicted outer membrane protein
MKTTVLAALGLSVAALSTPALAQDALPLRIGADAPIGAAATDTPEFRAEALRSDAASIEASRIALERSRNPRVRNYANRVLVEREATTRALLPEGTSLTATGRVVSDRQGIPTRLNNPVGVVLAPVTIAANLGTSIVGGVLGGVGIVDNSPAEPGRRVALGPNGQARIERLRSAPTARDFDRTYIREQARSDARTLALYQTYAQNGDSAAGRRFANEALPFIADEHAHSATLAGRVGG